MTEDTKPTCALTDIENEQKIITGIQAGCEKFLDWSCKYPECDCELFPKSFRAGLKAMQS